MQNRLHNEVLLSISLMSTHCALRDYLVNEESISTVSKAKKLFLMFCSYQKNVTDLVRKSVLAPFQKELI